MTDKLGATHDVEHLGASPDGNVINPNAGDVDFFAKSATAGEFGQYVRFITPVNGQAITVVYSSGREVTLPCPFVGFTHIGYFKGTKAAGSVETSAIVST